ncbi:MAG: class I SAM-dependent methyltransferase [Cyanobacteriota bacterium]
MDKVYSAHELAYQKLKKKGAKSWHEMYATEEGKEVDHIGTDRKRFIESILEKEWSPKTGNALEIGCGTGHLIRWINSKGFNSTGVDISSTAIEMAKEQSIGLDLNFFKDDFCYSDSLKEKKFDLIIDGSCFHCIVEDKDRKLFIEKAHNLLRKDGVFILCTNCSPINQKAFSEKYKTQKYQNNIFYVPYESQLEGSKIFNGKMYMAQRKIEHWQSILKLLKNANFEIKLFQYEKDKVFSKIYIAAIAIKIEE